MRQIAGVAGWAGAYLKECLAYSSLVGIMDILAPRAFVTGT